jgi:hypothetical protein
MNAQARHQLELLEALAEDSNSTQRGLAAKLGIALGLTNIYLKRLVLKGYVKCVNVRPNRLTYLITPSGVAEKTRLTYEFMEYSLRLYRQARTRVRTVLASRPLQQSTRLAIYGTGEAAEIAYLCLREVGVEPVAVFGETPGEAFFTVQVTPASACATVACDGIIVATFEDPAAAMAALEAQGIPRDRLIPLRDPL